MHNMAHNCIVCIEDQQVHHMLQHSTAQHITAQHSTAQHSTLTGIMQDGAILRFQFEVTVSLGYGCTVMGKPLLRGLLSNLA